MEEEYQEIARILLSEGWEVDNKNIYVFRKPNLGESLYIYPELKLLKYWEDIRIHSLWEERSIPISESDLLELIK
ncbi:hypothetical protein GCM10028807_32870 [Spirosoma daeguense]